MKKFPSFIKTSNYNRFSFEPRYYDPVKEEIEGKLKAAKMAGKNSETQTSASNISNAFRRRAKSNQQANVMQFLIAAILLGSFVAWLFIGNDVLYIFLFLSPAYFYFRLKKQNPKNEQE